MIYYQRFGESGDVVKRTPLYDEHVALGAKMVAFSGWEMPVQYEGILAEHGRVRTGAGLFDVSHMGEIFLEGPGAAEAAEDLCCNGVVREVGQAVYSPMCNAQGGVVDDVIVHHLAEGRLLIVVNAGNIDKDEAHIRAVVGARARVRNASAQYGQLALQGPKALSIAQRLSGADLRELKPYRFLQDVSFCGVPALVARTGYTGEDGVEIYLPSADTARVFRAILEEGKGEGVAPIGLGARDTLRMESAMPLYGHELTDDISPLEAGLSRFVNLEKPVFRGRDALLAQQAAGTARVRIGLRVTERGVARQGARIASAGEDIGYATSAGPSPTLGGCIALALVAAGKVKKGDEVTLIVRDRPLAATVVPLPFYKKPKV